jgi:hypothetical protein
LQQTTQMAWNWQRLNTQRVMEDGPNTAELAKIDFQGGTLNQCCWQRRWSDKGA